MQSTPPLLRQLLRSSFSGAKSSIISRSTPSHRFPTRPGLHQSPCLRCQFRAQMRFYSATKPPPTPADNATTPENAHTGNKSPIGGQKGEEIPNPGSDSSSTQARDELPSQEEGRRSQLSKRFSQLMDNLQSNVFIAGQRLNDLTGYSGIEALKRDIGEQGTPTTDSLTTSPL
jgi:sensitive to high expression protein 9